jgi:general secretion pathway protein G
MFVRSVKKGFTLVEILIVVIILGILAAIVIPQFTSASDDARKNSLTSQVQTLRSQVELYKLQHTSTLAELFAGTTDIEQWEVLTNKTTAGGAVDNTTGKFGPYLQTLPINNLNGFSKVVVATVADETAYNPADDAGFIYDSGTGKFWATNKDCSKLWTGQ